MMTTYEKVIVGEYLSKVQYPHQERVPAELAEEVRRIGCELQTAKDKLEYWMAEQKRAYREDEARLLVLFRADLEFEHGMTGHPKADAIYARAWERGHSSGLSEVAICYEELLELVK